MRRPVAQPTAASPGRSRRTRPAVLAIAGILAIGTPVAAGVATSSATSSSAPAAAPSPSATQPSAATKASASTAGVKALTGCKPQKNEDLDDIAGESYRKEYGGSKKAAARWMVVQASGMLLIERIQASPARKDYMRLSFANKHRKVDLKMRNHRHDRAIRRCARQMGMEAYLRIGIAKWSDADIDRASEQLYAAFPEPSPTSPPLFGISAGAEDFYRIDVYPEATQEQYDQIEAKARELGVGYRIRRDPDGPDIAEAD